jgi:hypothetical protein
MLVIGKQLSKISGLKIWLSISESCATLGEEAINILLFFVFLIFFNDFCGGKAGNVTF